MREITCDHHGGGVILTLPVRDLLFEEAWQLQRRLDYSALLQLLSSVSEMDLLEEPELGYLYAQAQFYSGLWNESLRLVQLVERPLRERGIDRLVRRRMNIEAMIRLSLGDVHRAETLLLEALEMAAQAGDEQLTAYARSNLGVVADIQCRWDETLVNYHHAMAAYQRLGEHYGVGQVHQNIAMTYRQLGFNRSSDTHFEHALACYSSTGNQVDMAGCEMERALLLSNTGDLRLAEATARRALQRFMKIEHSPGVGDVHRVLGKIALQAGRNVEASRNLTVALEFTRNIGDRLTEAETLEEIAVLQTKQGGASAADDAQNEAASLYRQMGADARADKMAERLAAVRRGEGW